MLIYVDRSHCLIDDTLLKLQSGEHFLYFLGPSGSGKTTTLKKLWCTAKTSGLNAYYIDCGRDNSMFCTPDNQDLAFVDNAQKLGNSHHLLATLKCFKSHCLAFSPLSLDGEGTFLAKCTIKPTNFIHFTPFTPQEYDYFAKMNNISLKSQDVPVLLPGIVILGLLQTEKEKALQKMKFGISNALSHIWYSLADSRRRSLLFSYLALMLNKQMSTSQRHTLLCSGLSYLDTNDEVKSIYPIDMSLSYAQSNLENIYRTFREYDLGASVEFLFSVTALTQGIVIKDSIKGTEVFLKPEDYKNQVKIGGLPVMNDIRVCWLNWSRSILLSISSCFIDKVLLQNFCTLYRSHH